MKRLGVSPRVVTVLEGESLLNDATALVLLRTAIVATAASVSFWGVLGQFVYAVLVAVAIGLVVGWLNLRVRARTRDAAVNTAISFTVPFLASIPAELLGASGLVAAVAAGLVTGSGAARHLRPEHRISDAQNWRTIELLLEGTVFLVMGLELQAILDDVVHDHLGIGNAAWLAALALLGTIVVRTLYVAPLVWTLGRSAKRAESRRARIEEFGERIDEFDARLAEAPESFRADDRRRGAARTDRVRDRLRRMTADLDYLQSEPIGWREGTVVVWAGMRGVVTLAAAQTLPADTPGRSLLVLIAFFVAAASLLLQGGTLPFLARRLGLTGGGIDLEERRRLTEELGRAANEELERRGIRRDILPRGGSSLEPDAEEPVDESLIEAALGDGAASRSDAGAPPDAGEPDAGEPDAGDSDAGRPATELEVAGAVPESIAEAAIARRERMTIGEMRALRLEVIEVQRKALHRARKSGEYSSETLTWALNSLDADQISIELRTEGADESGAGPA